MQQNRGMAKVLIILVSIIFLTAVGLAILFFNSPEDVSEINLADAQRIISIDERAGGISADNVSITRTSGYFARGKLTDSSTGVEKDFYLIKIGEVWRVVEITDKPVSCERFARLGFPNVFIPDCELSFSDAVTLSEIDATLEDFFKSSVNTNLKIIATVESIEETENGQLVTLLSGETTIQITLSNDDPSLREGDLIVTTITPPNNQGSSSSTQQNVVYTVSNPVVVNQDDRDLFAENPIETPIINPNITPPSNTDKIYKIDAPKTSAPPAYFFNVYDIDNSFVDVELDGNF